MAGATAAAIFLAGTGGGPYPPEAIVRLLAASSHGGWDQGPAPIAHAYNGKTYITWLDGSAGNIETMAWDDGAETPSAIGTAFSAVPYDDHNAATAMVRDDGHLMVAWAPHNADHIYLRINANPETVTWAAEGVIDLVSFIGASGGGGYTYISLFQLRGVAGSPIYCFFRDNLTGDTTGRIGYTVSTDGGVTWGAKVLLFAATSGNVPYFSVNSDWDTRLDVFTSNTAPGNVGSGSSTYHLYINGTAGTYHKSDGTAIVSPPFGTASLTLVESGSGGATWPFGGSYTGTGQPAVAIMRHLESPTNDNDLQVGEWTGSAWAVTTVAQAGGLAASDRFASGMDLRRPVADRMWCSRFTSGQWEVWEYVKGASWATAIGHQRTFGSAHINWLVRTPHERASGLEAVWPLIDFISSSNYDAATYGYG